MSRRRKDLPTWFHQQYDIIDKGYITPCWIWKLCVDDGGYGRFSYCMQDWKAHVWIWEFTNKTSKPHRHDLHHLCEIRRCVNPGHLELLTRLAHIRKSPSNIMTANIQNLYRR